MCKVALAKWESLNESPYFIDNISRSEGSMDFSLDQKRVFIVEVQPVWQSHLWGIHEKSKDSGVTSNEMGNVNFYNGSFQLEYDHIMIQLLMVVTPLLLK